MKKTYLKRVDNLSTEKSKKFEKLALKLLKFCRDNEVERLNIGFLSQNINAEEECEKYGNYINILLSDKTQNDLYNVSIWEERV